MTNPNHDQRHKYHHLATTLHLTLKMTTAQVVETSVTNNSLSEDHPHPDDHARQTTDTSGFKHLPYNTIRRGKMSRDIAGTLPGGCPWDNTGTRYRCWVVLRMRR